MLDKYIDITKNNDGFIITTLDGPTMLVNINEAFVSDSNLVKFNWTKCNEDNVNDILYIANGVENTMTEEEAERLIEPFLKAYDCAIKFFKTREDIDNTWEYFPFIEMEEGKEISFKDVQWAYKNYEVAEDEVRLSDLPTVTLDVLRYIPVTYSY